MNELDDYLSKIQLNPDNPDLHQETAKKLASLKWAVSNYSAEEANLLNSLLEILFSYNFVNHQILVQAAIKMMKLKYDVDDHNRKDWLDDWLESLSQDSLFLETLQKTLIPDLALEALIKKIRQRILMNYCKKGKILESLRPLACAVAIQCLRAEYIFKEKTKEQIRVNPLYKKLLSLLEVGNLDEDLVCVAAMYRPIPISNLNFQRKEMDSRLGADPFLDLLKKAILEPRIEKDLMTKIPSWSDLSNPISKKVRQQYEENPVPRWLNLGQPDPQLITMIHKVKPDFSWPSDFQPSDFRIFVPGCGTGAHPLMLAASNPESQVYALDLSKRSLAYGIRRARELKINNIKFIHGDLLELTNTRKTFHHIDCVGVLHHLEEPVKGWKALNQILLPGGTMHIGVYSNIARMEIRYLRQKITESGLNPTQENLRDFRNRVLIDKQYTKLLRPINLEFFNLSHFRDLAFHASEYHYTLKELKEQLEYLKLRFIGFNIRPALKRQYLEMYPQDPQLNSFANWMKFEKYYAGSLEMFRFWVQKGPA